MACLFASITLAQSGDVTVHADPRIDALIKKAGTPVPPNAYPQIPGYRIQLIFDSDKSVVDNARNKFIAQFPKVDTYITFVAPNYILKVGDFRTNTDAERIKSEIDEQFPTSFIVREMINLPRID